MGTASGPTPFMSHDPRCLLPDGRAHFDFTSWEGTRQLTATLLQHDFNIKWWLPEGQLVPTLTNRANYIHWLHDLLLLSSPEGEARKGGHLYISHAHAHVVMCDPPSRPVQVPPRCAAWTLVVAPPSSTASWEPASTAGRWSGVTSRALHSSEPG